MSEQRTVLVDRNDHRISYYDRDMKLQELGAIRVDIFGSENLTKFELVPSVKNEFTSQKKLNAGTGFALGIGSSRLSFVNPSHAQQILIDRGYRIVDEYATAGGSDLVTIFANEDEKIADPIGYDIKLWDRTNAKVGDIFRAIELRTSLIVGRMAVRFSDGIFRLVCANGARAKILNLPSVAYRHVEWDSETFSEKLDNAGFSSAFEFPRGNQIGTVRTMQMVYSALRRFQEAGSRSEQDIFKPFAAENMQAKLLENYLTHLNALISGEFGGASTPVYGVHLWNAYTSAVNQYRQTNNDRGTFRMLDMTDLVLKSTSQLSSMAEIFSGIDQQKMFETIAEINEESVDYDEPEIDDEQDEYADFANMIRSIK